MGGAGIYYKCRENKEHSGYLALKLKTYNLAYNIELNSK